MPPSSDGLEFLSMVVITGVRTSSPSHALDPHNHHVLTCKYGGDVVNWHNRLRDILMELVMS